MISIRITILVFYAAMSLLNSNRLVADPIGSEDIAPGALEVTRGKLVAGTVFDLADSDDFDITLHRAANDTQAIIEFWVFGNSVNAFPSGIDITIESSVFARSDVLLEVYAYDFFASEFELIDVRLANRFVDRAEVFSLSGDLNRFITPAAGNMSVMVRFVSKANRQQFAANVDQLIWTIHE